MYVLTVVVQVQVQYCTNARKKLESTNNKFFGTKMTCTCPQVHVQLSFLFVCFFVVRLVADKRSFSAYFVALKQQELQVIVFHPVIHFIGLLNQLTCTYS